MLGKMCIQRVQEFVVEHLIHFEKECQHGLVSDVNHQLVGFDTPCGMICNINGWSIVFHRRRSILLIKVVRTNDKAMQRLVNESKRILWVNAAEVTLAV